jgi:hypothetical protein
MQSTRKKGHVYMLTKKLLGVSTLVLAAGLMGACTTDSNDKTPINNAGCLADGSTSLIALNITADLCELEAGTYSLQGVTFVKFGSTLKLNPGVTIKGKTDGSLTALVVEKGGILHAVGTASNPVVFTAGTSAPIRGDFGGVVLLGRSQVNTPTGVADIEGLVGVPFGGGTAAPILNDSSGHLEYVRIEYAGSVLGADNELNGLTWGGVGNRTVSRYIHQYEGLDDCFEWFGGTNSAKYLVASGCDDDIFDYDLGWHGTLQHLVGYHIGVTNTDANGIEADGRNGAEESMPRTHAYIANMTLIGNGTSSWNGMRLRRGVASQIYNSIVTGFGTGTPAGVAVRVDGNTSIRLVNNDSLKAYGLAAWGNGGRVNVSAAAGLVDSVATRTAAITKINTWFLSDTTGVTVTRTNPKPSRTIAGAVALPTGKGFDPVQYVGAFDPAASTLWINDGTWVRKTNW